MLQHSNEDGRAIDIYREAESHLQKLFKMKEFYTKKLKDFTENRKCSTPLLSGSRYQHRSPKPRSGSSAAAFSSGFGSLSEAVHKIPQPQPQPASIDTIERKERIHRPLTQHFAGAASLGSPPCAKRALKQRDRLFEILQRDLEVDR